MDSVVSITLSFFFRGLLLNDPISYLFHISDAARLWRS
jgi:hypothetical protein